MWIKAAEDSDKTIFLNPDHIVKIYLEGDSILAETSKSDSEWTDIYVIFKNRFDPWYVCDTDEILTQVITSIECGKKRGNGILDLNQTIKAETFVKRKKSQAEIESFSEEEIERQKK